MNNNDIDGLVRYLGGLVTTHKRQLIDEVLAKRTRLLTVVLENIFQPHNASAVLRSCDCFGVQDIHIVENTNEFTVSPKVTQGSSKWLNLEKYKEGEGSIEYCISKLKNKGYQIVATTPRKDCPSIYDYEIQGKTALLFGTELTGLSSSALSMADDQVYIPMYGFTESFNISVSAALCLNIFRHKLEHSGLDWRLSAKEKQEIRLEWYKKIVKNKEIILSNYQQGDR
ncbi:MAG: RNA methyltransferase [Cyclobacteriaceae bacterium]|nr:RNA methyltransferase [Cyclobacteriaceae bacterium]